MPGSQSFDDNFLREMNARQVWHPMAHPADSQANLPVILTSGQGVRVTDIDGHEAVDAVGGLWNVTLGYSCEPVKQAIAEQLAELPYANIFRGVSNDKVIQLAHETVDFFAEDGMARATLAGWAAERGFGLIADEAGNLFVRRDGTDPDAPAVLSGSHLDTQPAGGNFDGIYGVLSAFETLEALEDAGLSHTRPIEAVVWTNEEGCRFAPGCTGSLVFSGKHSIEEFLDGTAPDGAILRNELERTLAMTPGAEKRRGGILVAGYIESHIEQGPRLESEGITIGAVTGIQGGSSFEVTVTGMDGHAGTVPLQQRRDAFRSAHAIIDALHKDLADPTDTVGFTVGRFEAHPGSPTRFPAR